MESLLVEAQSLLIPEKINCSASVQGVDSTVCPDDFFKLIVRHILLNLMSKTRVANYLPAKSTTGSVTGFKRMSDVSKAP